ncbi:Hypothetical protein ACI5QL_01911 [Bacillus velezensis]|nr:hypothetical protein EFW58_01066 [Bacillus velezensis]CUB36549.1 hypothetical protein BN2127_JRS5_03634 [Bacillus amyloliquefaciens]
MKKEAPDPAVKKMQAAKFPELPVMKLLLWRVISMGIYLERKE